MASLSHYLLNYTLQFSCNRIDDGMVTIAGVYEVLLGHLLISSIQTALTFAVLSTNWCLPSSPPSRAFSSRSLATSSSIWNTQRENKQGPMRKLSGDSQLYSNRKKRHQTSRLPAAEAYLSHSDPRERMKGPHTRRSPTTSQTGANTKHGQHVHPRAKTPKYKKNK